MSVSEIDPGRNAVRVKSILISHNLLARASLDKNTS